MIASGCTPTCRWSGHARTLACALAIAAFACTAPAAAKSPHSPSGPSRKTRTAAKPPSPRTEDPRAAQARQTAERARLVERIAALKKQIAAGEKSRAGTAASLARAERALADVNQRLAQLAERQRGMQRRIADLDRQRISKEGEIARWQDDLARTTLAISANRNDEPFQLYLTGRDPNDVMLGEAYLGYLARAEVAQVDALRGRVTELQTQRQTADAENRALAHQADAQKSARESLVADQGAQRQALEKLSQTLAEQRKSARALEADQKRLSRVVEQLQREIDRRAAAERARVAAVRRRALADARAKAAAAAQARRGSRGSVPHAAEPPSPPVRIESVPDASVVSGDFARLRGRLRLPVRGTLVARFGTARGEGGASWKGLFIRTESGAEVRAVAAGRVVFADYLRGFGNLLIVDHGDQYLSIYGNNETLLKHAGDTVKAGDVLSLTGNSSGDDQTGLYFELRFRGKPFDPVGWMGPH